MHEPGEITRLLKAFRSGDRQALDRLVPLVYDDLRRIARARLRHSRPGETLDTTSLVNEAWLRLADRTRADWRDRDHFLCVCARAMRQILISGYRRRRAARRGGGLHPATLRETGLADGADIERMLALDQALDRLEARDSRLVRIVECRHFLGLSADETARALDVTDRTVRRGWVRACAWLRADLSGEDDAH